MHALEAFQLADGLGECLFRHAHFVDLCAVLLSLLTARVGLAELRLDRAQLLAEEVLALAAAHLAVGLRLNFGLHRRDFELALEQRVDAPKTREGIDDLEDLLGFGEAELQVRGDEVGEATGVVNVRGDRQHLGRQVLERQQLLDPRAHGAHQSLAFDTPIGLVVDG